MTRMRSPLTLTLSPGGRGNRARGNRMQPAAGPQHLAGFPSALHGPLRTEPQPCSLFFPPPEGGRVREGVATMPAYQNDSQRLHARAQRAEMTAAEVVLWECLRKHRFHGLPIRRKAPVGPWIVDFLIPSRRMAICLAPETATPGSDHPPPGALERMGYAVLRPSGAELSPGRLPAFLRHLATRVTP